MRMTRHVLIAVLVHAGVLSLVWVGFPVALPRSETVFIYSGSLPAEDLRTEAAMEKRVPVDADMIKDSPSDLFAPWIQMRELDKPGR